MTVNNDFFSKVKSELNGGDKEVLKENKKYYGKALKDLTQTQRANLIKVANGTLGVDSSEATEIVTALTDFKKKYDSLTDKKTYISVRETPREKSWWKSIARAFSNLGSRISSEKLLKAMEKADFQNSPIATDSSGVKSPGPSSPNAFVPLTKLYEEITDPVDNKFTPLTEDAVTEPSGVKSPGYLSLNAIVPTTKLYEAITDPVDIKFTPLTEDAVTKLLDQVPELRTRDAAQGRMKAFNSIFDIQKKGIPFRLGDTPANETLKKSMQFILFKINEEPNSERRKELLLKLAGCVEDCVPVTQGSIAFMHMDLASIGGIESQISQFILRAKDNAVNAALYELHPEMKDPNYANRFHFQPRMQFPHMKTGYLNRIGKEFGLNCVGVEQDGNKNTSLTDDQLDAFRLAFKEKFSIQEVVKEFIKDVNGRHGEVDAATLYQWAYEHEIGDIGYDKDAKYPEYSTLMAVKDKIKDKKAVEVKGENDADYSAYLTEPLAIIIFQKLGYIE